MRRIAIIEDNEDNRLLVETILEEYYELEEYDSGPPALEAFVNNIPDLLLLDISLPGMDGVEILQKIRSDKSLCEIPIIALTAHAMVGDRERFLDLGFDYYISKPIVDEDILLNSIRMLLDETGRKPQ